MTVAESLSRLEIVRLRLPLARPWVSPVATMTERDILLVGATVDGVTGWGECVAQPDPTYSCEYVEGAIDVLVRHLVPRALAAAHPITPDGIERALAPVKGHLMAKAGLTGAILDAWLRVRGTNLAEHLGTLSDQVPDGAAWSPPATVPAGVAIGVATDVAALIAEVGARRAEGYGRCKIKIHPGWDARPVAALRDAFGAELALQVDANGSYAGLPPAEVADRLAALDGAGLLLIEQPLGDDDLVGHAALARALVTPLCLDESITSAATLEAALALGACAVVNVKPGRVGGLAAAVAVHDRCARDGVPVWCGGMLESGVGRAANLALAALPNFTLPGDLSASRRYWDGDVVVEPAELLPGGRLAVPTGPGSGVELRDDLDRWLVWRDCWER